MDMQHNIEAFMMLQGILFNYSASLALEHGLCCKSIHDYIIQHMWLLLAEVLAEMRWIVAEM